MRCSISISAAVNGPDSVAELLAAKRIPFVFVTGYGRSGVDRRFADAAVLQKPFTLPELRDLVADRFVR